MPKDKTGQLLDVGDLVLLRGKIVELHQTPDFSAVTVETEADEGKDPVRIKLDTAQVTLDVAPAKP